MGLSYNISFSVAAMIIVVLLVIVVSMQYSRTNLVNKRFRYFLVASIVMFALDIGTVISNDHASELPGAVNFILNSLYFLSGTVAAILFFYYNVSVALKDEGKIVKKTFYITNLSVFAFYAVTLVLNGFFHFYFHFDGGVYTHGPAYLAVNAISIGYIIECVVVFIWKHRNFNTKQIISSVLFYASFFLSFILQLFAFPDVLLSDFGSALGALMVFFSIETPDYVKLVATLNELNELKASLEIQVASRTDELRREKKSYEELTLETLSSLAHVIDAKDHYTVGHSFRVAAYAKGIAEELGLPYAERERIYFAGLIHDVGKIGINESILTKPGKLDPHEFAIIQSHSSLGGDILKGIREFPIFEQVARSHHERYDGTGYPDKLKGEDIPFAARIVAVADVYDAMTSDRSYRKALADEVAIKELKNCSGTQFDPQAVQAFLHLYSRYPDSIRNHIDDLAAEIKENNGYHD